MVKGLGGNWHCLLRFFGREKFFGGFPQLFSTFISQSSVLVCAKWMLTPPLQKKITHVPVGVFFGLILVHLFVFFWCTKQQILCFSGCFPAIFLTVYLQGGEPKPPSNRVLPWGVYSLGPVAYPRRSWKGGRGAKRRLGNRRMWWSWEFGRFAMRGWWGWKILETWGCFLFIFFLDFESRRWKKSIEFFVCESLRTEILFFRQDFKIMRYLRGQMRNQRSLCSWFTLGHSLWSRTQNVETAIWRNDIINQK